VLVRMLALGVKGGRVMLVDEATGEEKWAVQAHAGEHAIVAISPNNGRFENWKVWDVANGAAWMNGARHDGTGACACVVPDLGRRLLQEGCPVIAHISGLRALSFSPCGQMLASGGADRAVVLWDAQTGEGGHRMERDAGLVRFLSFSADGARLACASGRGRIRVWDVVTGALIRTMEPPAFVLSVDFSPTESGILASMAYPEITLWDVDSGEREPSKLQRALFCSVFSRRTDDRNCHYKPLCHRHK